MSLGYAEKLSYREDLGGQLGSPEIFDPPEVVEQKVAQLAELVRQSEKVICFTGAGVSTSCGIPDFRGPSGIWTLQRAGKPLPRPKVSFAVAKPSFTHAALVALCNQNKLTYIVSQNVDGLHLRSGIPRHKIAELHGNCFAERCIRCRKEYLRDFEVETVGFRQTGRKCTVDGCNGKLHDHVLDWEDKLPEDELKLSGKHAQEADLAICLGTSLQITPACNLPLKTIRKTKTREHPGKLVIINLQRTQHDKKAEASGGLVIRAKSDDVMRRLMAHLDIRIPPYIREDTVIVRYRCYTKNNKGIVFEVDVHSRHGPGCDMPLVSAVAFKFVNDPNDSGPVILENPPYRTRRTIKNEEDSVVNIELAPIEADKATISQLFDVAKKDVVKVATGKLKSTAGTIPWSFVTQVVHYHPPKDENSEDGEDRMLKRQRINA